MSTTRAKARGQTTIQKQRQTQRLRIVTLFEEPQCPGKSVGYRGHTVRKEPQENIDGGCYEVLDEDEEAIAHVELDQFNCAADWVHWVDFVIQHGPQAAADWLNKVTQEADQ